MAGVLYTGHAKEKFKVLRRHGFEVTRQQVEETLSSPDLVESQSGGKMVAQRRITDRHVLRVVYRQEGENKVVITFYPGRRERYESKLR